MTVIIVTKLITSYLHNNYGAWLTQKFTSYVYYNNTTCYIKQLVGGEDLDPFVIMVTNIIYVIT